MMADLANNFYEFFLHRYIKENDQLEFEIMSLGTSLIKFHVCCICF
jgi:hypothetical protein